MKGKTLARLLCVYIAIVAIGALAIERWAALGVVPRERQLAVVTVWRNGERATRTVRARTPEDDAPPGPAVVELGVAEAPLSARSPIFEATVVPGLDGVRAELDGKTAVVTVDDLLQAQGYDVATGIASAVCSFVY